MAGQTNAANVSRLWWRSGAMLFGLLTPLTGHAAPFCIGSESVLPQCIYYDADSCRKEAGRQGGYCSANPNEVRVSTNLGQYCVVTSQQVSLCLYLDRESCESAAARQHGACVASPGTAPSGAPDPFAANGGR
jgi:hypothetical protein